MIRSIAIVSLSRGILGEDFVSHEVAVGLKRLEAYGIQVRFMPHALKGLDYIAAHPEKRAEDLLEALADDSIDMILCAIGGDDTYRLLPFLFEGEKLKKAAKKKIFLGYSDSTMNHLMLHKLGIPTFYGQAFLSDVCELAEEMLPYSRHFFEELIRTGSISRITPSDIWYEERTAFGPDQLGVSMPEHKDTGFQLLQGSPRFEGKILGGCIDTLSDIWDRERYPGNLELCQKYGIFPPAEDWQGRILLLETSEGKATPQKYRQMLETLKNTGIFGQISGILMGKPALECFFEEYKKILVEVVDDPGMPILANINVGHATPRCIVPLGVHALVDARQQTIVFE